MTDDVTPSDATATAEPQPVAATQTPAEPPPADDASRCPWCSEVLPAGTTDRCPHCQAHLTGGDRPVPGLTEVEATSAVRVRRTEPVKRSRLLSWISGEFDEEPATPLGGTSAPDALELPPRDVRREMLRLQLEAEGATVASDGSIEYPTDTPAPTGVDAPSADADAAPADEVRKAS